MHSHELCVADEPSPATYLTRASALVRRNQLSPPSRLSSCYGESTLNDFIHPLHAITDGIYHVNLSKRLEARIESKDGGARWGRFPNVLALRFEALRSKERPGSIRHRTSHNT